MASPVLWQNLLDNLCSRAKEDGIFKNVEHKYSEEELVQEFLCGEYSDELINWIRSTKNSSFWRKCEGRSQRWREEGNKYFKEKNFLISVEYYCESVKYAKPKTKEFALAVANRAAGLIEMGYFEDALRDIDLAIDHGYPESSQYKLLHRKGNCLMHLKRYEEASVALRLAQENLKLVNREFNAGQDSLISISEKIANLLEDIAKEPKDSNYTCDQDETPVLPDLVCGESKKFPSASKLLSLQQDKKKGRFVIAIDNLSVGDVLFVEKPFAHVLLPEHYRQRCHHCCNVFRTPIPCWNCSLVLYCCEECRSLSWNQYHQWECDGGLAVVDSVGIAHLGLRIVLIAGSIETHKKFKEMLANKVNCEDRYSAVYHLVTNLQSMSVDDRAAYSLTAACLALYLEHFTNYFVGSVHEETSSSSAVINGNTVLIGGLIMRHICQLVCNGHAITAIEEKIVSDTSHQSEVEEVHQLRIATAIYPSASMMNHSCDPNIINSFLGTTIIIKAYKDIEGGREVFNCYGPNYRTTSLQERQDALRTQYHFECLCSACSSGNDLEEQFSAVLCPFCNGLLKERDVKDDGRCHHCRTVFAQSNIVPMIQACHTLREEGCELLKQGCCQEALECLMSCLSLHEKCFHRNNKYQSLLLDSIAKCLAMIGDFGRSVFYLQRTLPAVEEQYGLWSIEMAHELQKLSGLMIGDLERNTYNKPTFVLKYQEAAGVIQKAKKIFELHYGPWNSSFQLAIANEMRLKEVMAMFNI